MQAMLRGDPDGAKRYREMVFTLSVADPDRMQLSRWGTSFGRVSTERLQAFIQHMPRFDVEPDLPRIAVPTLVIVGRYDPQCPIENSEQSNASYAQIENESGQQLSLTYTPVCRSVRKFLVSD